MPIVSITIMPQSVEKKTEMAKAITNEINRITGIPKDAIVIAIHELSAENFAINGEMLFEKFERLHLKG
jgi:4-oxalocrotonate tautomerase family enzyme